MFDVGSLLQFYCTSGARHVLGWVVYDRQSLAVVASSVVRPHPAHALGGCFGIARFLVVPFGCLG
jgi:hypothetical protein